MEKENKKKERERGKQITPLRRPYSPHCLCSSSRCWGMEGIASGDGGGGGHITPTSFTVTSWSWNVTRIQMGRARTGKHRRIFHYKDVDTLAQIPDSALCQIKLSRPSLFLPSSLPGPLPLFFLPYLSLSFPLFPPLSICISIKHHLFTGLPTFALYKSKYGCAFVYVRFLYWLTRTAFIYLLFVTERSLMILPESRKKAELTTRNQQSTYRHTPKKSQ